MKSVSTILLAALLVSCQSLDRSKPADWFMTGRVIISNEARSERLNLSWRQFGSESEILLTGPLGASVARISGANNQFLLERPNQSPVTASTPGELAFITLGVELPIADVVPILNGDVTVAEIGPWQVLASEHNQLNRPMKVELNASDARIRLTVQSWQ